MERMAPAPEVRQVMVTAQTAYGMSSVLAPSGGGLGPEGSKEG